MNQMLEMEIKKRTYHNYLTDDPATQSFIQYLRKEGKSDEQIKKIFLSLIPL